MKKILFYLPFIKMGGIERVSIEYLNSLIEKSYTIDLIIDFNMGKDGNTFEYAIPKEVNFQYIKSEKISEFIYIFRTLGKKNKIFNLILYTMMILIDFYYHHTKVKKIVRNGKYDWTISFYQFLPAYLTKIKPSKHIIWLHGSVYHYFGGIKNVFKKSYGKKLDKYDYIVTIADEMTEQLKDYYPNIKKQKIKRIYNPFDFDDIREKATEISKISKPTKSLLKEKYICTVSRLDETDKDITTLIKAYKKLYDKNKITYKLYIIGDGLHKKILENLVKEYRLEDYILFLGKKTNPYIWIKNADLFVLSSKTEGLPTVLIEVMALDTFVISANCKTGPKEILLNGECGDLFEIGNLDQLAHKVTNALNDDNYRKEKIINASNMLDRFDKKIIIKQLVCLLE